MTLLRYPRDFCEHLKLILMKLNLLMGYDVRDKLELKLDGLEATIENKKKSIETCASYPKRKRKLPASKNSSHKHP